MSLIDHRDYAAIQAIARFKQLTAAQLYELIFYPASRSACYRSLDRLKAHRFATPLVDNRAGAPGKPKFIWVLDTEGLRLMPEGYRRQTSIRHHTLEIAETFINGVVLPERAGLLRLISYLTEPEAHERIGGFKIEPDLYVEVELPDGQLRHVWCETDMGRNRYESESDKHIKDKLRRYIAAAHDTGTYWPDYLLQRQPDGQPVYERIEVGGQVELYQQRWFPRVVWLVQNEWRARVLQRLISHLPADDQVLFRIVQRDNVAAMFV